MAASRSAIEEQTVRVLEAEAAQVQAAKEVGLAGLAPSSVGGAEQRAAAERGSVFDTITSDRFTKIGMGEPAIAKLKELLREILDAAKAKASTNPATPTAASGGDAAHSMAEIKIDENK